MSLFLNRSKQAGAYLEWKVRLFTVGATLAVGGMFLGKQWVVTLAIVVLAGGMLLRFLPGAPDVDDAGDEPGPEEGAPHDAGEHSAGDDDGLRQD